MAACNSSYRTAGKGLLPSAVGRSIATQNKQIAQSGLLLEGWKARTLFDLLNDLWTAYPLQRCKFTRQNRFGLAFPPKIGMRRETGATVF